MEFWDRVSSKLAVYWDRTHSKPPLYAPQSVAASLHELQQAGLFRLDVALHERIFPEDGETALDALGEDHNLASFSSAHNADLNLARCCYLACQALKPQVVVETGVANGVTTSFVLKALAMNRQGQLWSVDLPPLGWRANEHIGKLVPSELKSRWHLRRGSSKRVLAPLLSDLQQIDLFIHDSLHTYANMRSEFEVAWPYLRPLGILIADDVERNCAFQNFAKDVKPKFSIVVKARHKQSLFGILVKRD